MDLCAHCRQLTQELTNPLTAPYERRWRNEKTINLEDAHVECQLCHLFRTYLAWPRDSPGSQVDLMPSPPKHITLLLDDCKRGYDKAERLQDLNQGKLYECIIGYKDGRTDGSDGSLLSGHIDLELWAEKGKFLLYSWC
jgi:hypothetical protein